MDTERLTKYKKIDEKEFLTEPDTPHTIDYLITWLTEMKAKGATALDWSAYAYENSAEEVSCIALSSTPESDEQYNARIEKEKAWIEECKVIKEIEEKIQYKKLKAKYGQ